jgi:hypothetical protein
VITHTDNGIIIADSIIFRYVGERVKNAEQQ